MEAKQMQVSAEQINGELMTVIRKPFKDNIEWVRKQMQSSRPVVFSCYNGYWHLCGGVNLNGDVVSLGRKAPARW